MIKYLYNIFYKTSMENIPATDFPHIDKLWSAVNAVENHDWTIKEYKTPRVDIDCVKRKKEREQKEFFEKVWKEKKRYPSPLQKYDSKGSIKIPEKENYFDMIIKKKDFGYSPENEEKLKKRHSNHNRSFNDEKSVIDFAEVNKDKNKAVLYKDDRETVFDDIVTEAKKSEKLYPHKESLIKKLKEEVEKEKSASIKSISEILKEKYKNKSSLA